MTKTVEFAHNDGFIGRLPDSLQGLILSLSKTSQITSDQVYRSLLQAEIEAADLRDWETFHHSATDSYGRQLVYAGEYFEVMVMSWLPGDVSAIHDHGQAQWGAVQCFGRGTHTVYRLVENTLSIEAETTLLPAQIVRVNHSLIHQMSNYSQKPFLSLHVYGCYDRQDAVTGDARVFDLLEGKVQHTNGGVFFCLPESEIIHRSQGIEADRFTSLRHHRQMRDRILKILSSSAFSRTYWQSKLTQVEKKIAELSTAISLIR